MHCSMSRGLTKQGCYRPRRRILNTRSCWGPQVELWGLPAVLRGRTAPDTCHTAGLTHTCQGTMGWSPPHSLRGLLGLPQDHSPAQLLQKGQSLSPSSHIPGVSEGEKRCPESGAGALSLLSPCDSAALGIRGSCAAG